MNNLELLKEYIKSNIMPILISNNIKLDMEYVINVDASMFEKLNKTTFDSKKILVINDFDKLSNIDQLKYKELLRDRKISGINIPDDILIIVTSSDNKKINKEIFSLFAVI